MIDTEVLDGYALTTMTTYKSLLITS